QPVAATGQVDESGLALIGSHAGDTLNHPTTTSGTLTLGDPNSPTVTGASGSGGSGAADGTTHIQGAYGYLTITAAGAYTYTLTSHEVDASQTAGTNIQPGTDAFTFTVQDSLGNTNTSTITISIIDDVPTAKPDTDAAQSGETVVGNVETGTSTHGTGAADVAGADGIGSIAWTGAVANNNVTTVAGSYGTLTVQADGSYSYKANPNSSGQDSFSYTITDGDGDTSTATLKIDVTNGQPQPVAATGQVDESGLALIGSHAGDTLNHPTTTSGTLTLGDPNSPTVTGASGSGGSGAADGTTHIQGAYGYLTITAAGAYTYTLTSHEVDASQTAGTNIQPGTDAFTFTVQDSLGNTNTSTITISIIDDVPTPITPNHLIVSDTANTTGTAF